MGTAGIDMLLNHRLRHLSGLSVHNLVLKEDEKPPFSVCFALSLPHGDYLDFFYRSYDEWNSLHPDWKFIDITNCSHVHKAAKDFVVSIIIRFQSTGYCRLVRQWRIHITGLSCLGQEIPPAGAKEANQDFLMIQFGDFFYTTYQTELLVSPNNRTSEDADDANADKTKLDVNLLYRADESSVRETYGLPVLIRLTNLFEKDMKLYDSVREERDRCDNICSQCQFFRQQKADLEANRSKLMMLKQQLDQTRARVKQQKERHQTLKEKNDEKETLLTQLRSDVKTKNDSLQTGCDVYQRMRSDLKEYQVQIVRRRLVLARALQTIYPITKELSNGKTHYHICNLVMPDSDESFSDTSHSENHMTAAYGYAAQLIRIIAYIADVPLRYPIFVHNRARLYVRDNIVCQLNHEERNFPLHLKRQRNERLRFAYAVFLLNRNITLLRVSCGLHLKNVPSTLSNLHELLNSPLSPSISLETYNSAKKLLDETTNYIPAFSSQKKSLAAPILDDGILKSSSSSKAVPATVNSDIYHHGKVTDITT